MKQIICCFLSIFTLLVVGEVVNAQYQVIRTEGFDAVAGGVPTNLPFGWTSGRISGPDANNYVERNTTGGAPVCTPHSASAGMLRYRSGFMNNPGGQFFVASPRYDLTNNPGTATVSFWMYKDTWNTVKDSVTLYLNDSALANPSKVSMTRVIGPFSHDTVAVGVGWKQYTALIPAAFNTSSVYAIFVFTCREAAFGGANIYIDDFSIQTYPKPQALVSSTLFYQETSDINKGAIDKVIAGIKVITDGAGDSLRIDSIVTNANGTNLLSDIVAGSCKLWYTKGTNAFINSGNQFGVGLTPTFYKDKFTNAAFHLENGVNYFWVTISTTAGAVTGDCIDIDFNGIYYRRISYVGADTSRAPLTSSIVGCRHVAGAALPCNGIIPTLTYGTSGMADTYTNNDYINRVYLRGANSVTPSYPYIDNDTNDIGPLGTPAPFTAHPLDYQQFPQTANALHPNITAILVQNATYAAPAVGGPNPIGAGLALQCGTFPTGNSIAAWIDWNNDGDFLDVAEKIVQSAAINASGWVAAVINVPATLTAPTPGVAGPSGIRFGNTKMRVREVYLGTNIDPCQSSYSYGETEDYIVTIVPSTCGVGTKLWLGYTDDWNTAGNWCGGIPTINDVALIDEVNYLGGTQTGAPYDPVIHSGTAAVAKTIRLGATDSLIIDAPKNSSLTIADSLNISYNTPAGGSGFMKVNSVLTDSAQLSNGNITVQPLTPFMGTRRQQKAQFIYTKNELLEKGMVAGDVVDQLTFYFRSTPGVAVNFGSLNISYATVDSMWPGWAAFPTSLAPNTSPFVTIYSNPFFSIPILPVTGGSLAITLNPGTFIWNGVSDIVLQICYDRGINPIVSSDHLLPLTLTTGKYQYMRMSSSNAAPSGCSMAFPVAIGVVAAASQLRPNITFMFHRPYTLYPINIPGNGIVSAGQWVNNGVFSAGCSEVIFSNTNLNQTIGGTNVTTFNRLTENKTGMQLILNINTNVDTVLKLTNGELNLNRQTLTLQSGNAAALTRINGWIRSEDNAGALPGTMQSIFKWKIGITPIGIASIYSIPFKGTGTNVFNFIYQPAFSFTNCDTIGDLSIATYGTVSNNTPYPFPNLPLINPWRINAMISFPSPSVVDCTPWIVDRFWFVKRSIFTPTLQPASTIRFEYDPIEGTSLSNYAATQMRVQRHELMGATPTWHFPYPGQSDGISGTNRYVQHPANYLDNTYCIFVIGNYTTNQPYLYESWSPLPIELLSFTAQPKNNSEVICQWTTASETNNDYFTLEHSKNGDHFKKVSEIDGAGNSNQTLQYSFVDTQPYSGVSYYRLKQTDFNGQFSYSKVVAVTLLSSTSPISAYPNPATDIIYISYDANKNEKFVLNLFDPIGRIVFSKYGKLSTGINTLELNCTTLSRGVYSLQFSSNEKSEKLKIVLQ